MAEKLFLGKVSNDYKVGCIAGENIYLSKHSWDCGWYFGFGYIGNKDLHTHFDSCLLSSETDVNKIFSQTEINQNEWWIIRDLFVQAYALKKCAQVYRYGGHQTTKKDITDIIQDKEMENRINTDLKNVLETLWSFIEKSLSKTKITKAEAVKRFNEEEKPRVKQTDDNIKYLFELSERWNRYVKRLYEVEKCITAENVTKWINPFNNIKAEIE